MRTLNSYINYHHSNIYVKRAKLNLAIQEMKALMSKQYANNIIEIPAHILLDEIKKAKKLIKGIDEEINLSEQQAFHFGAPSQN